MFVKILGILKILILIIGIVVPSQAQGYIDPGAGAMLWQILAASFIGAVFLFRKLVLRWLNVRWLKKRKPEE